MVNYQAQVAPERRHGELVAHIVWARGIDGKRRRITQCPPSDEGQQLAELLAAQCRTVPSSIDAPDVQTLKKLCQDFRKSQSADDAAEGEAAPSVDAPVAVVGLENITVADAAATVEGNTAGSSAEPLAHVVETNPAVESNADVAFAADFRMDAGIRVYTLSAAMRSKYDEINSSKTSKQGNPGKEQHEKGSGCKICERQKHSAPWLYRLNKDGARKITSNWCYSCVKAVKLLNVCRCQDVLDRVDGLKALIALQSNAIYEELASRDAHQCICSECVPDPES